MTADPATPAIRTTTVDGVAIDYVDADGEPDRSLVFVHGGCHGSWCWQPYLTHFAARGWRGFALNWYGHGGSRPLPDAELARRGIAAVVEEIHTTVGFAGTVPVLVGHSMGALAAQCYAAAHDVAGLVLVAPAAPLEVGNPYLPIPVDPDVPFSPPPFEDARQMFFTGFDEASARRYHALLGPESAQAILEVTGRAGVPVDAAAVRRHAPRIQVVAAEHDALTPPDVTARVADYVGAEYHLMPGQSHDGLLLGPGWTAAAELIADFLDR
jgi:pimeloyl-ACP methyl ester carboxylesterase